MSLRRIAYLLLLLTLFAIPFEDIYKLPGIGTLARLFGLLTFAAWALSAFVSGRMRRPASFHGYVFGLVAWVGLSLLWSLDSTTTLDRIETFLQLLGLTLVMWDLCSSAHAMRQALQALVLGFWVAVVSVFINFAQGVEAYYGRFAAAGADPNYQSMSLAVGMAIAWYLAISPGSRGFRILNVLYIPAAAVAMGLTGSRGGFLAGFVALAYILSSVTHLRRAGFVGLIVTVAAAVAVIVLFVPATSFERISSVTDEITEGDLNGRAQIWLEATDAFVERPVVGIGAGASRAALPTGKVPHNVTLTLAVELGIVGLILFGGAMLIAIRSALRVPQPDRRLWLVLLLIWGLGSLSLNLETRKLTWILLTMAVMASSSLVAAYSTPAAGPADGSAQRRQDADRSLQRSRM